MPIDPVQAKKIADDFVSGNSLPQTNKKVDFQKLYQKGGRFKEQLEAIVGNFGGMSGMGEREGSGVAEKTTSREAPVTKVEVVPTAVEAEKKPELEGFVEDTGADMELMGGVTDDYTQRVLLGSSDNNSKDVELPLSEAQVQEGLHHKVWESIRWLAEWCVRQVKVLHGKVKYKS